MTWIDTDKYEGHAKEKWYFDSAHVLRDGYGKEIAELVGGDWLDDEVTQRLIEDAPLLFAEVKRLHHALVTVTAKIYMNENDEPYDYEALLDYCFGHIGEPDDMSGDLGKMISEWWDE